MKRFSRLATVGVVAALGVGFGAAGASAYSISGGGYTGARAGTITFASSFSFVCAAASYSGAATGADTTSLTPSFGPSCPFYGFPGAAFQSGAWDLKVVAGPDGSGYYDGELTIPTGTTTSAFSPTPGCSGAFSGPQSFRHGFSGTVIRMKNVAGGATLEMNLNGITHSATGTCFSSGSGGAYSTNGAVTFPGVTVS